MKIKCIRNCTGVGYENFKKGQTRNLKKGLAEKLIGFGYAVEAKGGETPPDPDGKGDDKSNGNDK